MMDDDDDMEAEEERARVFRAKNGSPKSSYIALIAYEEGELIEKFVLIAFLHGGDVFCL